MKMITVNPLMLAAMLAFFAGAPISYAGGAYAMSAPQELDETTKIEKLIASVEKSGAIFIRNGSEYQAASAAAHMRMKLARAGGLIKTADQFIEYIASKSSITGRPYYIKFEDGRKFKSAEWLRARLAEIENGDDCCSVSR